MKDYDKLRRAGLVNRVRRNLANFEFHLAGQHDQKSHGNWATGLGDSGGVGDFSDTFDGFFDPHGLADKNAKIQSAGAMALAAIDAVHGLEPDWPKVIAMVDNGEWLGADEGSLGAYMAPEPITEDSGSDRGRVVFRGTDDEGQMASTLVHELGHHLSLGRGVDEFHNELNEPDSALSKWMDAVKGTDTYKDLQKIKKEAMAQRTLKVKAENPEKFAAAEEAVGFVDYLLMPEELFARSYAQYIALKTGSRPMINDLNRVLKDENMGVMQWLPSEYGPISDTMEAYLRSRGLLK